MGSRVALIGTSGSGKSTLAYILSGLYLPASGKVVIDGVDMQSLSNVERSNLIGIVAQDCYLFSASILENFKMVCPFASRIEIENACKLAHIHDFIAGLPEGYETLVGERGARLSGGQRQRIALARVILKRPRVIIFDESTSAIDPISEEVFFEMIKHELSGHTIIFITHRINTVKEVDEILLMSGGRLIAQGSHLQLTKESSAYQELTNSKPVI